METSPVKNPFQETLDRIVETNRRYDRRQVKRALILYEDAEFVLGDNIIILHNFGLIRQFLGEPVVFDLNIVTQKYVEKYKALLGNNPHFDHLTFIQVPDIPFDQYDLVICISTFEVALLHALHARYTSLQQPMPGCAIFSYSKVVFTRKEEYVGRPVFPIYEELVGHATFQNDQPYELYLSEEERHWGDRWLEEKGIKEGESLYVIVDNASRRHKVITPETYYGILLHLLKKDNIRILIFDEEDAGKAAFYKLWFGEDQYAKFIFSCGLKLRQDLCLIGSHYTRMVFGPCTGLLHCAAGIFNNYHRNGMPLASVPLMITYTGGWNAEFWWGKAKLVTCLLVRNVMGEKKMSVLTEMNKWEREYWYDRLECYEFTADMIISYLDHRLIEQRAPFEPVA